MKERTQKILVCLATFGIGGMILISLIPTVQELTSGSAEEYFEEHGSYPALLCQIVCAWFILQASVILIVLFGILIKEKKELQNE